MAGAVSDALAPLAGVGRTVCSVCGAGVAAALAWSFAESSEFLVWNTLTLICAGGALWVVSSRLERLRELAWLLGGLTGFGTALTWPAGPSALTFTVGLIVFVGLEALIGSPRSQEALPSWFATPWSSVGAGVATAALLSALRMLLFEPVAWVASQA